MTVMQGLPILSRTLLIFLLALMGLLAVFLLWWQVVVLKGGSMRNPDGSVDDWKEQKTHYGIALADIFLACPVTMAGIILVFAIPRWGYYLLALSSFWFVWANVMTTANSMRFEKPRFTLQWFVTFPLGALLGLAYLAWTVIHFDSIYLP
jgi:hypothetical protein